ncbi:hypothetical protein C8F04DRAFT_1282786 [Mycena alexandri]|uniref:Uncharacterized protein n=1 Tax=Mycena alexandri TaxID=1745969 RepID=A0AAD6RXG8_9AGAR|nr:hypothetical protein C8F04DRAFT_1282786 [Mycena alexandri]
MSFDRYFPAPRPVTLPIILRNINPLRFPVPRILMDIDPHRTPTPPLAPTPAHPQGPTPAPPRRSTPAPPRGSTPAPPRGSTPAPSRGPTPAPPRGPDSRESSLTPTESDDNDSDSSLTASSRKVKRPSGANIQSVKDLFKPGYPELTEADQLKKYTNFRSHLDTLCARYLRPAVALSFQDKEDRDKVYTKMTAEYPWLVKYQNY